MIEEVFEFQKRVLGCHKEKIAEMSASEAAFIVGALEEELEEWQKAVVAGNVIDQVDALLDLTYFAIGGIYKLGLSADQTKMCFEHIHTMNMKKVPGVKSGREGMAPGTDAVLLSESHEELSKLLRQTIGQEVENGSETTE